MSNRFNKPEILKENRRRYAERAARAAESNFAKVIIEMEKAQLDHDTRVAAADLVRELSKRPKRSWGERFMEWATGC